MVDFAFIDGTFYDKEEINYRDISEIPHPFIIESIELLKSYRQKKKTKFISFISIIRILPWMREVKLIKP